MVEFVYYHVIWKDGSTIHTDFTPFKPIIQNTYIKINKSNREVVRNE